MKKLIALIVTLSMMLGMCTTAFAATVTVKGDAISYDPTNGTYTVDAANAKLEDENEAVANNTQHTIVVISGTEINTSSIQYINQQSKEEGTSFTFVPKDEATFLETDTDVTLTAYIGGDKITKASAGTITYAAPVVTKYTVTFKANDAELSSKEYEAGAAIEVPADPTKAEDENYTYTFAGWYDETDAEQTVVNLTGATATKTVTYVAKFTATAKPVTPPTPDQPATEYTVTYMANGAVHATVDTVDGIPVLPTEPTKADDGSKKFAFIGWYTDEALTTKLDKTAKIDTDTTVYALIIQVPVLGDIDGDYAIGNRDFAIYQAYNLSGESSYAFKAPIEYTLNSKVTSEYIIGDVDGDGEVANRDFAIYQAYNLSGESSYPIGTYFDIIKD